MNVKAVGDGGFDLVEELTELAGAVASVAFAITAPVAMSSAANSEVVPWSL